MDELLLRFDDDIAIAVPRSLDAITTYVLLEQEAWFEKEARFVAALLSPGETVIDIGANLGVYALAMARRVGPMGRVFAYEPASDTRALLEKSRALNRFDNLDIIGAALSEAPGEARLSFGWSSELNTLGAEGAGEAVRVTTLDAEDTARAFPSVDFIKMDAEGEEIRILKGAQTFFARHSPLVMFEIKSGIVADEAIAEAFKADGFRLYRLLHGAPLLVPVEEGEAIDQNELNLFAAKPDRAARLAAKGLLVEEVPPAWTPDEAARRGALDLLKAQPFAQVFAPFFASDTDGQYRSALAGYAAWRDAALPWAERYGALLFAYRKMIDLCQTGATPARLATLARIGWEMGRTGASNDAINALLKRGEGMVTEPFWPVSPRFDAIRPGANPGVWFLVSAVEHLERYSAYSSLFTTSARNVEWLATQPLAAIEMERRRMLKRLKAGERLTVPERLLHAGPDHINVEVWRSGLVPNTLVVRR
jgi:FkbM family methyltransferase